MRITNSKDWIIASTEGTTILKQYITMYTSKFSILFLLLSLYTSFYGTAQDGANLLLNIDEHWRSEQLTFPDRKSVV